MKLSENKQTFGFRKLTVGLASVTLATTFLAYHSGAQVKAAETTSETVSNSSENQDVVREASGTNQAVSNSIATNSNTVNANATEKDAGADTVSNKAETSLNDKASASTTNAEIANKADLEANKEKPKDRPFVAMLAANAKKETVTRPKITPESAPEVISPKITSDLASEDSGSVTNVDGKTINPSDPRPWKQTKSGQDKINIHWVFADNSVTSSKDGLIVDPDLSGQNVRDDAKIVYQKYVVNEQFDLSGGIVDTFDPDKGYYSDHGGDITETVNVGSGSILIRNDLAGEGTTADPSFHMTAPNGEMGHGYYAEGDIKGIPLPKFTRNGQTYVAGAMAVVGKTSDRRKLDPDDTTFDVTLPLSSEFKDDDSYDITIYYFKDVRNEPINVKVKYLDSDDDNRVIAEKTISGKVGESVAVPTDIPENYEYQNKGSVPTKISFTEDMRSNPAPLEIALVHVKKEVQVIKDVTRTVVGIDPKTNEEFEIAKQTAHFTGHATKDMVTGKTTDPVWDKSTIMLDRVTPTAIPGYSPDTMEIGSYAVNPAMESFKVTVRYTANDGTQTIIYRDQTDGDVGKQTIDGKTDQRVAVTPEIPDGYEVKGDVPETVTIKDKDTPIIVEVVHGTIDIQPDNPPADDDPIPGTEGKKFPAGVTRDYLNKTVTRTVNIIDPHTQKATTTTQEVTFKRGATLDKVTLKITYHPWSENGQHTFDKVNIPDVPGYVASGDVPSLTVTPDSQSTTVTVTYNGNAQSTTITYVDDDRDGQAVGSPVVIAGKTGQTVATNITAPENYVLAPSQEELPKQITFTNTVANPIVVHLKHKTEQRNVTKKFVQGAEFTLSGAYGTILASDPNSFVPIYGYVVAQKLFIKGTQNYDLVTRDFTGEATWDYSHIYQDNGNDNDAPKVKDLAAINSLGDLNKTYTIPRAIYFAESSDKDLQNEDLQKQAKDLAKLDGYPDDPISIRTWLKDGLHADGYYLSEKTSYVYDGNSKGWMTLTKYQQKVDPNFTWARTNDSVVMPGDHAIDHINSEKLTASLVASMEDNLPDGNGRYMILNYVPYRYTHHSAQRTINIHLPNGEVKTITQTAEAKQPVFTIYTLPDARNDKLASQETGNWTNGEWAEYDAPVVAGYTASQQTVSAKTVTGDTQNETIDITYLADADLSKTVTRTVNITDPSGKKTTTVQTVTFTRDATVDKATGKFIYGNWSENGKHTFDKVDVPYIPGYRASEEVPKLAVTPDSKSTTIDVTYAAKTYDVYIFYVNGTSIYDRKDFDKHATGELGIAKPEVLHGHYGESINIPIKQIQGYYVDPYDHYSNYKFGIDNVTGQELSWYDFSPTGDKDLKDPLPEDASDLDKEYSMPRYISVVYIKDDANEGYNTRSYNIGYVDTDGAVIGRPTNLRGVPGTDTNFTAPTFDGYTLTNPQDVPAKFGNISQDIFLVYKPQDVKVTYHYVDQAGKELSPSVVENNHFTGLINVDKNVKQIDGYRLVSAPKERVVDGLKDLDLSFVYTASDGTQTIIYQGGDGSEVSKQVIPGKIDETVKVTPEVPKGWTVVGDFPAEVTIKPKDDPIVVTVEHKVITIDHNSPVDKGQPIPGENGQKYPAGLSKDDLNKTIIREIEFDFPSGKKSITAQTVTFTRDATLDLVTGKVIYKPWSENGKHTFAKVEAPEIKGYVAISEAPSIVVTPESPAYTKVQISYKTVKDSPGIPGTTDETTKLPEPDISEEWHIAGNPFETAIQPEDKTVTVTASHNVVRVTRNKTVKFDDGMPDESSSKFPSGSTYGNSNRTITQVDRPTALTDSSVMDVAQASHTPQTQNQATQLPQTGAKDGFAIVALGLVLISLSAAGLATRKHD